VLKDRPRSSAQKRAELLRLAWQGGDRTPELSSGGLPRLGHTTHLLHQVEGVIVDPLFRDFAARDAVAEDAAYARLIAGCSVAHKLTVVGAPSRPASNHPVAFGYQILNRNPQIRQGGMVHAHEALKPSGPRTSPSVPVGPWRTKSVVKSSSIKPRFPLS
jgi:hypothetical protein